MSIKLIPEERELLKSLQRKERKDGRLFTKITCILMLDMGFQVEDVAEALSINVSSVYRHQRDFVEQGLEGFLTVHFQGYRGKLTDEQTQHLDTHLSETLYQNAAQICVWVLETFEVAYTPNGMTALLHRLGYSYKKTRRIPGKADAQAQEAFVEQIHQTVDNLEEDEAAFFMDGVHPEHNTAPSYGWIKKGQDHHIKSNTGRNRININGMINATDPTDVVYSTSDRINAQACKATFRKLIRKHPEKRNIYVFCDNARYYKNKELQKWLEDKPITLIHLPAYSPNLNLIERLWKFLRKKIINTVWYETFEEFQQAIRQFFRRIRRYKKELESLMTLNFEILGT